jgi:hypothetical protein
MGVGGGRGGGHVVCLVDSGKEGNERECVSESERETVPFSLSPPLLSAPASPRWNACLGRLPNGCGCISNKNKGG